MKPLRARLCSVLLTMTAVASMLPTPGCGDDNHSGSSGGEGGAGDGGAKDGKAGESPGGTGGSGNDTGDAGSGGAGAQPGQVGQAGEPSAGGSGQPLDPDLPKYTAAGDDVQAFLNALAGWTQPPIASESTSDLAPENRSLLVGNATQTFKCARVEHDIVANHDEILNFDVGSQYVLPGLILQGQPFQDGELAPIPFSPGKRAPIKLYVNVAGTDRASE